MDTKNDGKVDKRTRKPGNPLGKGGFGDNPQNRNPGGWKSEDSISHQYKKIMRMTDEELKEFKLMPNKTQAQKIALKRIENALKESGLNDTKEITDRTEGKAPQSIDMTSNGESMTIPTVRIIDERPDQRHTDTE